MVGYDSGGRRERRTTSKRSSSGFRSTRRETMSGSSCTAGTSTAASTARSKLRYVAHRATVHVSLLPLGRDGLRESCRLGFEGFEGCEPVLEVRLGRHQRRVLRGAVDRAGGLQRRGQRPTGRRVPHREQDLERLLVGV